jgi:hypothetical protein
LGPAFHRRKSHPEERRHFTRCQKQIVCALQVGVPSHASRGNPGRRQDDCTALATLFPHGRLLIRDGHNPIWVDCQIGNLVIRLAGSDNRDMGGRGPLKLPPNVCALRGIPRPATKNIDALPDIPKPPAGIPGIARSKH